MGWEKAQDLRGRKESGERREGCKSIKSRSIAEIGGSVTTEWGTQTVWDNRSSARFSQYKMRASKDHSQIAMEAYIWGDPLFPFQSSFHFHHSIKTALSKINSLHTAKPNSQYAVVIFLGLSIAFSTFHHSLLLEFFFYLVFRTCFTS